MDEGVIVVFCDGKGLYHGARQAVAPFLSPHLAYVYTGKEGDEKIIEVEFRKKATALLDHKLVRGGIVTLLRRAVPSPLNMSSMLARQLVIKNKLTDMVWHMTCEAIGRTLGLLSGTTVGILLQDLHTYRFSTQELQDKSIWSTHLPIGPHINILQLGKDFGDVRVKSTLERMLQEIAPGSLPSSRKRTRSYDVIDVIDSDSD